MFGLPLRTFLPTTEKNRPKFGDAYCRLDAPFQVQKDKLKLLREIEIIIIDEASMLRADVLDMMDFFSSSRSQKSAKEFGGVQMLFIGDLYQLPPVVRDEYILSMYYSSPFFFHAKALEEVISSRLN